MLTLTLLLLSSAPDPALAATQGAAPAASDEVADPAARLTGTFRFVGGERQRSALRDAIDKAVEQLSWVIRGIGRSRLEAVTKIPPAVTFEIGASTIKMTYFGRPTVEAPADGTFVQRTDPQGKPMRVSFTMRGDTLVQKFEGENGVRTNRVTVSEDGQRMTVRVSLESKRLQDPLKYTLSYRRGEG
ncbi:MAG: hypothetical protein KC468_29820 [Myxococcales bacterium]|nr:hypothetical protein [Myxococcales bacterium]